MEKSELSYWMALAHLEGMRTKDKMEIVVQCFKHDRQLSDFFNASDELKEKEYHVTKDHIAKLKTCMPLVPNYSFMAENLLDQGYDIITVRDEEYPPALKKNLKYNSPLVIYTKGDKSLLQKQGVAVVGSRKAGPQALAFTTTVAAREASAGNVIVSGFAKGVDRQALDASLAANGYSIAVLPQGITTFTSGYKQLYKHIIDGHVLIMSYFMPTAGWSVGLAMARNAIVYALASKIFVAESDSKGGTWSGAIEGINRQRKNVDDISIYVRVPEEKEKNANRELIEAGAKPVNSQGDEIPRSEAVSNIEKITNAVIDLLKTHELRPQEVASYLKLDWSDDKVKRFLNSLSSKGVMKIKKGRYNVYTAMDNPGPSLF